MFNKLKQIKDLRSKAKAMESLLGQVAVASEKNGVRLAMDGNFNITELVLNPALDPIKQAEALKSCFRTALDEAKKKAGEALRSSGGFDLSI